MIDLTYKFLGNGHYVKWNPVLGVKSELLIWKENGKTMVTVRHSQPPKLVQSILDLNVARQNSFTGYKGKEMVQATSIPQAQHKQIMKQCGFQAGHGYDEKKFKQIVNSRENYKFKTVPGNI